MKFKDYVVRWKAKARLKVSEGWKLCQDQIIRDHIAPYLDSLEISEITPDHISDVLIASENKGHSKKQQLKIYNVLSKIFNDAIHFHDFLSKNPVRKRFHRPSLPDIERPALTLQACFLLLEYTFSDCLYSSAVWIQILSGIRVSEIQALEWRDIDWDENKINVRRAYNKHEKRIQSYTKNKTHYQVPLTPKLRNFLQTHQNDSKFVCARPDGRMMSAKSYDEFLKRISIKLKLSITSSHGLRHSCAKMYKQLGATDEEIQELLGHKHPASTMTYIHKAESNIFEIAKKIA